jgi:hypothetical protein
MIETARQGAVRRGVNVEFLCGDVSEMDLRERSFRGAFITPLVYSMLPGRAKRVRALVGIGRHLERGAKLLFSVDRLRSPLDHARAIVVLGLDWMRHRKPGEFGDGYSTFLTAQGTMGFSYIHRFTVSQLRSEMKAGGFRLIGDSRGIGFIAEKS